jgi:hypothetical protein
MMGQIEADSNFEPTLYTRVDLSRFAPGGNCKLYIEGCMSWVRELTETEDKPIHINTGGVVMGEAV